MFPQQCGTIEAFETIVIPAILLGLVFVWGVQAWNYRRGKLIILLLMMVVLFVFSLQSGAYLQVAGARRGLSVCEMKALILVLSMWGAGLAVCSVWERKAA